jgi:hypothetical protein
VTKYSPDREKSIDIGAFLKIIQSIRHPVKISNTFIVLSRDEQISHLLSGFEKVISVILFYETFSKILTFLRPFFALSI